MFCQFQPDITYKSVTDKKKQRVTILNTKHAPYFLRDLFVSNPASFFNMEIWITKLYPHPASEFSQKKKLSKRNQCTTFKTNIPWSEGPAL